MNVYESAILAYRNTISSDIPAVIPIAIRIRSGWYKMSLNTYLTH